VLSLSETSDYALEPLREGVDFTLHRGKERSNQLPILAVTVTARQPSAQNLHRLKHEYSLAPELDEAWAARPLALAHRQGATVLILSDPGGDPLDRIVQGPRISLSSFLRIAIGLAAAVSQVHRQGLIHKDVKPANILVDRSGRVWLTGFGIASRLPRERQTPGPPEFLAGSLPYMAPEQTGRMNRSIDSRSDLYALGVTLYELLTGSLPFAASDPMEWVHCHIARQPMSPSDRDPGIPAAVSAIILKLLAKTAEARYQTAVGLERDLQLCLTAWETHGCIDAFSPGRQDRPDRLLIPEKLYGRASEIDTLTASFDRVLGGGRPELVLVSGYSGIGKSSVVNELHKSLVPPRGFFAAGKFDQYKRDIPYATLAQAFQSLIRPILAKSEEELSHWRGMIREAVGPNGQLMVDLVPELKLVIGEQPPVPELSQQDAQSRFQLVFRRFISAFTREHPLALFLDDLQWLDGATLDLMADLLTHPDVQDVLVIGAYRDNEVSPAHPLMRRLQAMQHAGAIVHEIVLMPLARTDLQELISDSLYCDPHHAAQLAGLVIEKTSGNPFFAIQFMSALFDEGLLTFDHTEAQWCWDPRGIHAKGYTDNVVDLMVAKLNRLAAGTRKALQQLACLGNSADFATLSMVYRDSIEEMHDQLWEAERSGLVFRLEEAYAFSHDRVQEAAYSLIPQDVRAEEHLRIGMLMASNASSDRLEDGIFEIVNQVNRGARLLTSIAERENVADLNLLAGRRARVSTAYASAIIYLQAGRNLLTEETWHRNYRLAFGIETVLAECEVLTADMFKAEERLARLAERAATALDLALVARLRVMLYVIVGSHRGIDVFIEYQRRLGNEWSPHPSDGEVTRAYNDIMSRVESRTLASLIDLPIMSDAEVLGLMDVLAEVVMVAIFTDANFLALVLCEMVRLSLQHGNCDASCFAYVSLGTLAGSHFGDYEAGYEFGKLGYDLVEKKGLRRYQARVYLRFALCIMPWTRHINTGRALIRGAFDAANRIGDLTFAAYSGNFLNTNLLGAGDPLAEVQYEAENGLAFAAKARFLRVIDQITTQLALTRTLRGLTTRFGSFDDGQFDEGQFEQHLSGNSTLAVPECWYWTRKLQARFFAGDYTAAVEASQNAARLLWSCYYYFEAAEYHFYSALARAAAFDLAAPSAREAHVDALLKHHRQLAIWAKNCPENFENRAALAAAEIARINGRDLDAMQLYEQAIRSARANGFVHNEAVANERAGQFNLARGLETVGYAHLHNARDCYGRWGATAKVKQLDDRYSRLRHERPSALIATMTSSVGQLDIETVVKSSQALSTEMFLPRLIEQLMRIATEHAGAERGFLILVREGEPRIEAEAIAGPKMQVTVRPEPVTSSVLAESLLHYVVRTKEMVLLDNASADNLYSRDPYVARTHAKSILCLPIVKQTQLVGALYLENNLAPFVFTPDRVIILQLLASQAAISLENAGLYTDLRRSEAFLAQGQTISRTGTFGWNIASGELYWSNENYKILEYDGDVPAAVDLILQRVHPDDREAMRRALEKMTRGGMAFECEHRLLMPDGRIKHAQTSGRPVHAGSVDFVGTICDVTERVLAEEALRQAQADLARINRVTTMGELAASLAHELSQPISGAMTNTNTCLRKLASDHPDLGDVRKVVARILRDAQRAAEIIGRIRSQFVSSAPFRESVDLDAISRDIVSILRDEAVRHNISLRVDVAPDLPQIVGDRVQLQQVAMNLIMNAIEATKNVDGTREVLITSQRTNDGQILVSVSDTGVGLQPQLVERIFDPFFTTKPKGTGMGLRISRSIVESHGGRLWAANAPGGGAVFRFSLPAAIAGRG
jgi:predicted ATPase/signal transduction histidine kinase